MAVSIPPSALPATCSVAYKEWSGVCNALASGRQTILLRKGGIAEGAGGFRPEHDAFWLYPTHIHEAEQGLREPIPPHRPLLSQPAEILDLTVLAVVCLGGYIEHESLLGRLDEWHVWTPETLNKRFHYRRPGLWVLGVRAYVRSEPARIAVTPGHAGCKTWVPLEQAIPVGAVRPALDDAAFAGIMTRLDLTLNAAL
jgi:hypothetical protein